MEGNCDSEGPLADSFSSRVFTFLFTWASVGVLMSPMLVFRLPWLIVQRQHRPSAGLGRPGKGKGHREDTRVWPPANQEPYRRSCEGSGLVRTFYCAHDTPPVHSVHYLGRRPPEPCQNTRFCLSPPSPRRRPSHRHPQCQRPTYSHTRRAATRLAGQSGPAPTQR